MIIAATASLADGCFALSENFVTIFRQEPVGGTVSTEDGTDAVILCTGNGASGLIRFDSMGISNSDFTYVVTDTNNVVLFLSASDEIDFDSIGAGISRVWGLALHRYAHCCCRRYGFNRQPERWLLCPLTTMSP